LHILSLRASRSAHPPRLHSFPTRRSSDLTASGFGFRVGRERAAQCFGRGRSSPALALEAAAALDFGEATHAHHALCLAARLNRRSEEHTSELQSRENLVCRLLLEKKKT